MSNKTISPISGELGNVSITLIWNKSFIVTFVLSVSIDLAVRALSWLPAESCIIKCKLERPLVTVDKM